MVVRKMKEKCKDAARMRREKERTEFVELSRLLPLPSNTTNQLDKASIIRLTSSYLRMRAAFPDGLGEHWGTYNKQPTSGFDVHGKSAKPTPSNLSAGVIRQQRQTAVQKSHARDQSATLPHSMPHRHHHHHHCQHQQIKELGSLILQTLDGFVFALHKDGKIMYISETASVHLGLPQIDLTGSSIYEYIHPTDCNDINELFNLSETDKQQLELKSSGSEAPEQLELGRSFCMRMKCILPKRNAGLVSNGYKAIHCSGYMKVRRVKQTNKDTNSVKNKPTTGNKPETSEQQDTKNNNQWEGYALVAVGHSLLPSASTEVKLGTSSFMFRASLDLKIYQIESAILHLTGLDPAEMTGQSLYQFVHVEDSKHLAEAHRLLLNKGQVVTKYYRLMRRDGGFVWIESHASLINTPRSMPKPQHIVSVCYVIGQNTLNRSMAFNQQQEQHTYLTFPPASGKLKPNHLIQSQQPSIANKPPAASAKKREHAEATKHPPVEKFKKRSTANYNSNQMRFDPRLHGHNTNDGGQYNTIGSTRRPSDDSCSVVSNTTSASISSSGSSCSSLASSSYLMSNNDPSLTFGQQTTVNQDGSIVINGEAEHESGKLSSPVKKSEDHQVQQQHSFDAIQTTATAINSRPSVISNGQQQQQQIWLVPMLEHNDNQYQIVTAANAFTTTPSGGHTMDHFHHHPTSVSLHKHDPDEPHQQHYYSIQQSGDTTGWLSKEQQLRCTYNYTDDNNQHYEQQYKYNGHSESCYHQLNEQHRQFESGFNYETSYITHLNELPATNTTTYIETEDCPLTQIQCHHHHNHYQHAVCLNDRYATTTMQIT